LPGESCEIEREIERLSFQGASDLPLIDENCGRIIGIIPDLGGDNSYFMVNWTHFSIVLQERKKCAEGCWLKSAGAFM